MPIVNAIQQYCFLQVVHLGKLSAALMVAILQNGLCNHPSLQRLRSCKIGAQDCGSGIAFNAPIQRTQQPPKIWPLRKFVLDASSHETHHGWYTAKIQLWKIIPYQCTCTCFLVSLPSGHWNSLLQLSKKQQWHLAYLIQSNTFGIEWMSCEYWWMGSVGHWDSQFPHILCVMMPVYGMMI